MSTNDIAPTLRSWAVLDTQIRQQRASLDALYRQRAEYETIVQTWMQDQARTTQMDVRYGSETLRCRMRSESHSLTWTYLTEQIGSYFRDTPSTAKAILTHLRQHRPATTILDITRVSPSQRKAMSK